MRIALIDVDSHNYPNLALMKISGYFKSCGHDVGWYNPGAYYDVCFKSKVFSFTSDPNTDINAGLIVEGGTGYYYPDGGAPLPWEIEHFKPDTSIYWEKIPATKNTAYGFLTRGCPRGCEFCIVGHKEGRRSVKVANLNEFWSGERNIELLDPNFFACKSWGGLSEQLIASKAWINFSQGCDIRIMTKEKLEAVKQMRLKRIHFAWDKWEDRDTIVPQFEKAKEILGLEARYMIVYVLTNFDTTIEQDLERIYTLRKLGYNPYLMIYEKDKLPRGHILKHIQTWVNYRPVWAKFGTYEEFAEFDRSRKR